MKKILIKQKLLVDIDFEPQPKLTKNRLFDLCELKRFLLKVTKKKSKNLD